MDQRGSIKIYQELLLGISDHFTRNKVYKPFKTDRIVGGITGKVKGKDTHLYKSFNTAWRTDTNSGELILDEDSLKTKLHLENQVNKDFALLGFYLTGPIDSITDTEKRLYNVFRNFGDSIVILLYDPTNTNNKKLPQTVWETTNEGEGFRKVSCDVCALPEELIALESVMKSVQSNVQSGSKYVAGMKNFETSQSQYCGNLEKIRGLLTDEANKEETELLRLIKEMIINYPDFVFESSKENLRDKFIMANLINMGSTIISTRAKGN